MSKLCKLIKRLLCGGGLLGFVYSLTNGTIMFFRGLRNIDLSFNYVSQGLTLDLASNGHIMTLSDLYLIGFNEVTNGFYWVISAIMFIAMFIFLEKKGALDG